MLSEEQQAAACALPAGEQGAPSKALASPADLDDA
jgi:hypothetical protein